MKTVVFRCAALNKHRSWRPRSLTDMRGPVFPDEYDEICILDATTVEEACEKIDAKLGDVIFMGENDELTAYVIAPYGWELIKFGREWRSP